MDFIRSDLIPEGLLHVVGLAAVMIQLAGLVSRIDALVEGPSIG